MRMWLRDSNAKGYSRGSLEVPRADLRELLPCRGSSLALVAMSSATSSKTSLNDNASLQAGIVELRELLQSSNDEVQNLRQQIVHHQPIDTNDSEETLSQSVSLDQQLGWDQPSPDPPQREVHVHHHYHAKLAQKRDRPPTVRRTSRRRAVVDLRCITHVLYTFHSHNEASTNVLESGHTFPASPTTAKGTPFVSIDYVVLQLLLNPKLASLRP